MFILISKLYHNIITIHVHTHTQHITTYITSKSISLIVYLLLTLICSSYFFSFYISDYCFTDKFYPIWIIVDGIEFWIHSFTVGCFIHYNLKLDIMMNFDM